MGETVEVGCIVRGYPYPTVEIVTPRNLQFNTVQLTPSSNKLQSYKYYVTIPKIDESWNKERIFCTALQNGGLTAENFAMVKIGGMIYSNQTVMDLMEIIQFF